EQGVPPAVVLAESLDGSLTVRGGIKNHEPARRIAARAQGGSDPAHAFRLVRQQRTTGVDHDDGDTRLLLIEPVEDLRLRHTVPGDFDRLIVEQHFAALGARTQQLRQLALRVARLPARKFDRALDVSKQKIVLRPTVGGPSAVTVAGEIEEN